MNEHSVYPLTLYFDSQCPMCRTEMQQLQARDAGGALRFVDICAPDFACPLPGVRQADLLRLMHAQRADGQVVVGVEAFRLAYAGIGLHWVDWLTRLPVLRQLAELGYPWIARHRYRLPASAGRWAFTPMGWLNRWAQQAAARRGAKARCDGQGCDLPEARGPR